MRFSVIMDSIETDGEGGFYRVKYELNFVGEREQDNVSYVQAT